MLTPYRFAKGAAVAFTAVLLATPAAHAATRLAGTDAVGTHVSAATPGSAEVYKTTATATGDSSSISLHLDATSDASAVEVGVYADEAGQPTTLLTSGRADAPAAGWNEVTVPATRLEAGETYWIALLNPIDGSGTLRWTDRAGGEGGGEQTSGSATLSTLPDVWVTGGVWSDGPLSAFVSGEPPAPVEDELAATPSALSFWATRNAGNPAPKSIAISNLGDGALAYSATESVSWLSLSSATGSTPGTIKATVNSSGLAAGTYTATVRVGAAGADDRDVPVTLTVNPSRTANGLVGAWAFEETGGETVLDASGERNSGSIQGASRTAAGVYGRGVNFDGQDDWITIADDASLDLRSGMTLEAWVKPDQLENLWRTVLVKEQTSQLAYALYAHTDAGHPSGHIFTGADHGVSGPAALPVGEWSHVATTFDGSTLRLYVNGAEAASIAVQGPITVSNGALRIGGNAVWAEWFDGTIDEVRVYNRALSPVEILADRDTPIAKGSGSELSPVEKLKALLMKLLARWKKHWGEWSWHGHRGHFHGGR